MDMDQVLNKSQKRILLVEDEIDLRVLYAEVLRDAGYIVEEAPDGEIGLEKVLNSPWDMLLLDIMLPGKDGLRVLKDMGNGHKRGPIIMLTNLNSEHIIQEAFKMGADGYLIKSEITPDKIITEVESFLANSKQTNSEQTQSII
jgi:two-component system response regulator ResD